METANRNAAQGPGAAARLAHLKKLLSIDPDNPRLTRECIDTALQAGDFEFVLERADRALAKAPGDLQGLFDRASGLIGMRQYREAAAVLRALLERDSRIGAAQLNLGLCHYCMGEYAAARTALDSAYAAGDRSAALLRLLVSSCHHLGLMAEALEVSDANPGQAESDADLAGVYSLLYLDANRLEAATRWATVALARKPNSLDALVVQATLAGIRLDVQRARAQFERALQIAPTTGRALIGLGTLALLDNDFVRAKEQLTRGLQQMPNHLGSWHVLAWAHVMSNELDAAHAVLQHALELDRNFAETHGGLASVDALRGSVAQAQRRIDLALRLDSQCLSAQFARSVLARRAGRSNEAQQIVKDTLAEFASARGAIVSKLIGRVTLH